MLGIQRTTKAVAESAEAVKGLADSANRELSETSAQLRSAAQFLPYVVVGVGIVSVVALIVALVAVSRD